MTTSCKAVVDYEFGAKTGTRANIVVPPLLQMADLRPLAQIAILPQLKLINIVQTLTSTGILLKTDILCPSRI
jgi:hypothetical protein